MGVIQRAMVKACPHVWFERSEVKDRHLVAKRCDSCWLQAAGEGRRLGEGRGCSVPMGEDAALPRGCWETVPVLLAPRWSPVTAE